jgi:hypothetical protein
MNNRRRLLSLLVAVFSVAGVSRAVGAEPQGLLCSGYVAGVADAMLQNDLMAKNSEGVGGWHACFRTHPTVGQLANVVKQWLQSHPEKRDNGAAGLVAEALQQAFPCSP